LIQRKPCAAPVPDNYPMSDESGARRPPPARLASFYRALSEMGHAVVHVADPGALYHTLCSIAVSSCGAQMAWIGLVREQAVVPVAWAGGAEGYTEQLSLPIPAAEQADAELGPTGIALRTGQPYVCNDFFADPRTGPYRALAARFGVKASGAFPIRREGRVIGTLNVYFDTIDAFDSALVDLLEQLVLDLCFALEHIDQQAARAVAERAAHERGALLSGIVETAMDAIVSVDRQFNIVLFNGAASRVFGVSPTEVIGQPLDRFLPPEHRQAHRRHLELYAARGQTSRQMGYVALLEGLRANGERFPIEASISKAGEDERLLMTVMLRDVTQLRQAERAQLARAAAESASRAKTEFLSRISHELRTPLNAVLGFAQLLRGESKGRLDNRQQEQIGLVLQAGTHLKALIDEMLDIARIESGQVRVEERDFELCELLDAALHMSAPQAEALGVSLRATYRPGCAMLMRTDPGRLRQVLLNLLSNAIKYNRPGGWVSLEVQRDEHLVHLLVRDNGLGMSEAQRAQLFQPFNRLGRENSEVQGTGIGLVVVRQLVDLMGGEITIESRPDKGTLVRVTLPATVGAPLATPRAADPADPQNAPQGVVLYIEDNPINVILVEQLLARWPRTRLVTAANGAEGLHSARTLKPDVVLLDIQLPDMSGLDVLQRLKADPQTRDLVVVALSANALPDDMAAARAAGASDYWTKPIDFDAFLQGMRWLLDKR
jgi:PAS domain S-box-containing protein